MNGNIVPLHRGKKAQLRPDPPPLRDVLDAFERLEDVKRQVELSRAALIGLLHEAHDAKVPTDDLVDFVEPVTDELARLENECGEVAKLVYAAATRLHRDVRRS